MWAWVPWLGLRLRPATPGWGFGVRVCLCARSTCTPPLLAGVCGAVVCARAPVLAAPRLSWLACWVCLSLSARSACIPPLLARVCGVGVCAWARVSAAPRHSWLGRWGVCVFVCALRLYPATPGWGVAGGRVCLGSGFSCAPPLPAGALGCVCVCVRALLVPRHSWLGCVVWVCVPWLAFRLRPANPGWAVGVCVCLWARPACTLPLLAGMCGVGVCAWARVAAAPRHSWLGCWGVCVFVGAPRFYPATPGWGVLCGCVCLGSGFGCAPPLLAAVLGFVCVCGCAPPVSRHSWLGCAVWVFVPGLGLRLRPASPGFGVGVCVCLWACPACTSPLLARVCAVGVCARARVSAAPRHSWLGCLAVCVFVGALRLYPATPGWGVQCGCLCLGLGCACAPPLLAQVSGCVCACVRAPLVPRHSWLGCALWVCVPGLEFPRHPATPGWGVWGVCVFVGAPSLLPATPAWGVQCGCVCLGSGFGCAPPIPAGALGCVCVCGRASCVPRLSAALLVPRHSWLGCSVWVCVPGLGLRLRPATPGWGVKVCVCLWARLACTPPLLAGVCGVVVGARARISAAPRQAWLWCWAVCVSVGELRVYPASPRCGVRCGCVCLGLGWGCAPPLLAWVLGCACVCVRAPLVPRHSWLGCALWGFVLGLGFRLRPATPGWGVGVCVLVCSVCLYPTSPGFVFCGLGVAWHLFLCPRGCPWQVPPASVLGCVRCGGLRV